MELIVITWDGRCAAEDVTVFAVYADGGYPGVNPNATEYDGFLWNGQGVLESAGCSLESLGGNRPINASSGAFVPGELPYLFRGDVVLTRNDATLYTLSWTADVFSFDWRDLKLEVTSVWSCPNDDVGQIQESFDIATGVDGRYSEFWDSSWSAREGNGHESVTCTSSSNGSPGQFLRSW